MLSGTRCAEVDSREDGLQLDIWDNLKFKISVLIWSAFSGWRYRP